MVAKGVIVALALMALANRSFGLTCLPCHEIKCGPSPTCSYGVTKGVCACCDECLKGPGEKCGGPWGVFGACSEGLECQLDPIGSKNDGGICGEKISTDPCATPPDAFCTLAINWDCDGKQYNNGCEFAEAKCRNPQLKTPPCANDPIVFPGALERRELLHNP